MNCSVCNCKIEEEQGDIIGYFGICQTAFCVWCLSSLTDMVIQLQGFDDINTLQERIDDLKEEEKQNEVRR